jgi:DNA-binding protein HU-beta
LLRVLLPQSCPSLTELTKKVAVETRLSQRAVSDVMNATLEKIQWALRHGDKVTFPGFGTFYTRQQKGRQSPGYS